MLLSMLSLQLETAACKGEYNVCTDRSLRNGT